MQAIRRAVCFTKSANRRANGAAAIMVTSINRNSSGEPVCTVHVRVRDAIFFHARFRAQSFCRDDESGTPWTMRRQLGYFPTSSKVSPPRENISFPRTEGCFLRSLNYFATRYVSWREAIIPESSSAGKQRVKLLVVEK